jgi:cellulose synthase/poly-beta-1,6-N-acetylglucosamine synthase-like glycosyltransferase
MEITMLNFIESNPFISSPYTLRTYHGHLLLLNKIRKKYRPMVDQEKLISVITPTKKNQYIKNLFENYQSQTYRNKELIIILNNNQLNIQEWQNYSKNYDNVQVYQLDENISLGACLNYAIQKSQGEFIAKFDDDDYYGPEYLLDMITHFQYTNASVNIKNCVFVYFEDSQELYVNWPCSFRYMDFGFGGTQVYKREVAQKVQYHEINVHEDLYFLNECQKKGFKLYSADPFNYVYGRWVNPENNTWDTKNKMIIETFKASLFSTIPDYKTIVRV